MLICKKASLSLGSKWILAHHISSSNSEDIYCAGEWIKFCDAMGTQKPAAFMRDQRSLGGRGGGEDLRFLVATKFSQTIAKQPICQVQSWNITAPFGCSLVQFRAGPPSGTVWKAACLHQDTDTLKFLFRPQKGSNGCWHLSEGRWGWSTEFH